MATYTRQSPLHALMETLNPEWIEIQAMRVPKTIGDAAAETAAVTDLALCDVSALRKFGAKGVGAPAWLEGRGVRLPNAIYDYEPLGDGGAIMRVTADEFFLEEGLQGERVATLKAALGGGQGGAYPVERQDAGFLLCGARALEVLSQTCAIDFDTEPEHVVMSRVAGVSCTILPRRIDAAWMIRLWCSPSFAHYLGGQLLEITHDCGGVPVGLDSIKHLLKRLENMNKATHQKHGLRSSLYQPLSNGDVNKIADEALRVLEKSGMMVYSKTSRDAFKAAGADVDESTCLVKLPRALVEDAVASNPSSITLFSRDGETDIVLEKNRVHYGTGGTAIYVLDPESDERRPSTTQDVILNARMARSSRGPFAQRHL